MIEGAVVAIAALVFAFIRERDHIREREILLNRVQAPQAAVAQSMPDPSVEAMFVPVDDDEAYWDVADARRINGGS